MKFWKNLFMMRMERNTNDDESGRCVCGRSNFRPNRNEVWVCWWHLCLCELIKNYQKLKNVRNFRIFWKSAFERVFQLHLDLFLFAHMCFPSCFCFSLLLLLQSLSNVVVVGRLCASSVWIPRFNVSIFNELLGSSFWAFSREESRFREESRRNFDGTRKV